MNENDIPELLGLEPIKSTNHIARLRFAEQNLYSAVFENSDGTRTMYISSDTIKYRDANGTIREKSIKIEASKNGYCVEKTDTKLYFNELFSEGVVVNNGDIGVSMIPLVSDKKALISPTWNKTQNKVTYQNAFGNGIDIVYTPVSNGVKEDIIINNYNGENSFAFLIKTNGLSITSDNFNNVFVVDTENTQYFQFGNIVVYDNNNDITDGSYDIKTIVPNQQYKLTITVNNEFLKMQHIPLSLTRIYSQLIVVCAQFLIELYIQTAPLQMEDI